MRYNLLITLNLFPSLIVVNETTTRLEVYSYFFLKTCWWTSTLVNVYFIHRLLACAPRHPRERFHRKGQAPEA
jgi:hypothetical protein